ncbi:MAG: tyrosine-type recombinase/integrase [Bacilli bacterium]|nr:tyrosine-type recombinase/integrase [Bacilli bacterium]
MQEKVDKYIYYISENRYRVKFLKVDKKRNIQISFDQYINGSLEEAKNLRDNKLKENGLYLETEKKKTDIFADFDVKEKKQTKTNPTKPRATVSGKDTKKVDKYLYEIEKGKKYRIFIRKGGSNGQKGEYYSKVFEGTLAQAKKERDKRLAELKLKNGKSDKGSIRFIDFVRIYYKEYAEVELSPTTVTSGKSSLRTYILPEIANYPLNKIDVLVIQKIINNLKERDKERKEKDGSVKKLSGTTVNGVYRLLRKILNKAVAWDYIETNPVLKVKTPEVSKKEKQSYNREELMKILDLLKEEGLLIETLFTISICTGLRRGEILGLHIDDIDFINNSISVKRAVVWDKEKQKIVEKDTKTKNSVRSVPIPLFCTEIIKEYFKLRDRIIQRFKRKFDNYNPPKNLFLSKYGGIMFPDSVSSKWIDFRKRHPEIRNVSLHGLRHSYCTMQMNENPNLSPADVQKLMGHSQLSTTFIYTHSNEDKTLDAISVFDKYYNAKGEVKTTFNQMLSLYTGINFAPTKEINDLLQYAVNNTDEDRENKLGKIQKYIDNRYPIFKKINVEEIDFNNVWDKLEYYKEKYGNEFILIPLS